MKNRGFTMVEVIIVVAIIAVLASIIIPKMTKGRYSATLRACEVNLKHMGIAAEMYANDNNGGCLPHLGQAGPNSGRLSITGSFSLVTLGYLKSVPTCPSNPVSSSYGYSCWVPYDRYYFFCNSSYSKHPEQLGIPDDFPRYDSAKGILER